MLEQPPTQKKDVIEQKIDQLIKERSDGGRVTDTERDFVWGQIRTIFAKQLGKEDSPESQIRHAQVNFKAAEQNRVMEEVKGSGATFALPKDQGQKLLDIIKGAGNQFLQLAKDGHIEDVDREGVINTAIRSTLNTVPNVSPDAIDFFRGRLSNDADDINAAEARKALQAVTKKFQKPITKSGPKL